MNLLPHRGRHRRLGSAGTREGRGRGQNWILNRGTQGPRSPNLTLMEVEERGFRKEAGTLGRLSGGEGNGGLAPGTARRHQRGGRSVLGDDNLGQGKWLPKDSQISSQTSLNLAAEERVHRGCAGAGGWPELQQGTHCSRRPKPCPVPVGTPCLACSSSFLHQERSAFMELPHGRKQPLT